VSVQRTTGPAADWVPQRTLPGHVYSDPDVWREEQDRLFATEWICVGREEELPSPGTYQVRNIADESVLLTRAEDGRLHAHFDTCSHRGTRLLDGGGELRSGVITCPYHAWTFAADGEPIATPNASAGAGIDRSAPLWPIGIETWNGFVFVNMSAEPEPLRTRFARGMEGDITEAVERWGMGALRIGHRITYEVEANWKLVVENYSECLHCPGIHPELVKLVPLFRTGTVEGDDGAELAGDAVAFTRSGTTTRPPLPGLSDHDRHIYMGNTLFPTTMINLHADCVMTYRLEPAGPTHTRIVSEFLFDPDTIAREDFDPSDVAEMWDIVSRQDWAVCERAQRGVGSRSYARGGVHPYNDHSVVAFNERYRAAMA
jgi:Rieske 2Fe-2S family protein